MLGNDRQQHEIDACSRSPSRTAGPSSSRTKLSKPTQSPGPISGASVKLSCDHLDGRIDEQHAVDDDERRHQRRQATTISLRRLLSISSACSLRELVAGRHFETCRPTRTLRAVYLAWPCRSSAHLLGGVGGRHFAVHRRHRCSCRPRRRPARRRRPAPKPDRTPRSWPATNSPNSASAP